MIRYPYNRRTANEVLRKMAQACRRSNTLRRPDTSGQGLRMDEALENLSNEYRRCKAALAAESLR